MDYVTALVQLSGDPQQVVYRSADKPLSWPEVLVLQFLHGDDAVYDCKYLRSEQTSLLQEKNRLIGIYGAEPVETVYPGRRPQLEAVFPGDRPGAPRSQETKSAEPALRPKVDRRPAPNRQPEGEVEI